MPSCHRNRRRRTKIRWKEIIDGKKKKETKELGVWKNLMDTWNIHLNKKRNVVLVTIQLEEHFNRMEDLSLVEDLKIYERYFYNQTKNHTKDYHFVTTGSIFSFGYGPMYSQNPITKHSIDRFSNKTKLKKNHWWTKKRLAKLNLPFMAYLNIVSSASINGFLNYKISFHIKFQFYRHTWRSTQIVNTLKDL